MELRLDTPPHALGDAPDVIVHVPSALDLQKNVTALVFLHGFSSCARALAASEAVPCQEGGRPQRGYGLAALHEQAHTNSVLIIPQLAFLARDARRERFARSGGFDALLLAVRERVLTPLFGVAPSFRALTLLAHSAGYRAIATILRDPQLRSDVRNLVLFDALYAHWDVFARWYQARPERRLVSFYTADPHTTRGNQQLRNALDKHRAVAPPIGSARGAQVVITRVATPHGLVPSRHFLEALGMLFGSEPATP